MMSYIKRVTAKKCKVHQAIKDECINALVGDSAKGYFSKVSILDRLGYSAMEDSIRWDYVAEFIEEELGYELTPLTKSFFTSDRKDNEIKHPKRVVAMGHGKRCHGYASMEYQNGALEIVKLQWRNSMKNGMGNKVQKQVLALQSLGKLPQEKAQELLN